MTITEINTARYYGLNLTDLQMLLLLAERGEMSIGDLAHEIIGLTEAAISHAAKRLVAKHLIKKVDRKHDILRDRREVWIDLCELGRVRIHQITGRYPEPLLTAGR